MFRLVDSYDTRRRGMRSKITRLFVYSFYGAEPSARFDAGLVNPDGTPRKAYAGLRQERADAPLGEQNECGQRSRSRSTTPTSWHRTA